MTSHSDPFEVGEQVWEAFAWMRSDGQPHYRIRRATFTRSAAGHELLHYEDGRVDTHWPTSGRRAYRTHAEAVGHCVSVFAKLRRDLEDAIDTLMAMADEDSPAGPGRSGSTTAGTAPPEVAK